MNDTETTRKRVSEAYARAVSTPTEQGCGGPDTKGVAVTLAGYAAAELALLPDDAVVNSMGCGDPVSFTQVEAGDVVVDLGSGAGIDILLAGRKVGPGGHVIGIDMTDEMIERARSNIADSGLDNVEVRKGLIEDMPVESGSADWVISNCVINLSPEKDRVFAEIARVLKPGGRMVVSDIVAEELPAHLQADEALYDSCIAGAISEADYTAGLERAGLADVAVESRIHYDQAQLEAVVESDLEAAGCCGSATAANAAAAMAGKVWSARFVATKPA